MSMTIGTSVTNGIGHNREYTGDSSAPESFVRDLGEKGEVKSDAG